MTAPLIDILLATYNGARYLAPQLDSLLGQTHQHFRLLVSDDGSTDATLDILRGYRAAFGERLILLPNPSPGAGVVRNFERLMQASLADGQAQWAASCDQDDVWLPDKLATQWAEMQRIEVQAGTQTPCLVHGDLTVVNERLEVISPSFAAYQRTDPAAATALSLLSVNQVTGCAMMVNRALLRMALPVPPEAIMHDWWCALISGSGRRSYLPAPLLLYRQLLYCLRLFLFCVEYLVFSVHSHPHFLHLQSLLNSLLFAKPANITRSHNKVSGLLCG